MKNLLIFLAFVLCSCSPEDLLPDVSNGTILEATIDGDFVESRSTTAIGNDQPNYFLLIGGILDSGFTDSFFIGIDMGSSNEELNYQAMGDCSGTRPCHFFTYSLNPDRNSEIYFTTGNDEGTSVTIDFEIIDYREGGRAKGTFSGVMINDDTGKLIDVKNGKFDTIITIE